jgi:hypothetical protein
MTIRGGIFRFFPIIFAALFMAVGCGGGDGGGGEATATERTAFYTSTEGSADLSSWPEVAGSGLAGLEAADAICQTRADNAGLAGSYVAWLSDPDDDAYCRIHGLGGKKAANCGQSTLPTAAGPWFRVDGTPFASRIDLLTEMDIVYTPIRFDEHGSSRSYANYWTGTDEKGELVSDNCSGWTSSASSLNGNLGNADTTVFRWTAGTRTACSGYANLLCMEKGVGDALPSPGATGKLVFVTSVRGNGNLGSWPQAGATGAAAGDAVCRQLARNEDFANAGFFKAWLSDSSTDARDRITSDGPWVRPDGFLVARNKSDLIAQWLQTSIAVDETGRYKWSAAWTGTLADGTADSDTCSDWAGSSSSDQGQAGDSTYAYERSWTQFSPYPCHLELSLYCFED